MACVVPFAGANDDAHVIVFPRVAHVRQILVRAVKVNVIVVITIEERTDVERAAQADEMTHGVRMTKSDVRRVICSEARTANCDAMTIAFAAREIEYIAHDYVLVRVMCAHPIGWMNRFVVKTFEVDGVRAIDRHSARIDIIAHGTNQAKVLVLIITAE